MCYVGKATKIFIFIVTVLVVLGFTLGFGFLRHGIHKSHSSSPISFPTPNYPIITQPPPNSNPIYNQPPSEQNPPPQFSNLTPPPPPPPPDNSGGSEGGGVNASPPPPSPVFLSPPPPPPIGPVIAGAPPPSYAPPSNNVLVTPDTWEHCGSILVQKMEKSTKERRKLICNSEKLTPLHYLTNLDRLEVSNEFVFFIRVKVDILSFPMVQEPTHLDISTPSYEVLKFKVVESEGCTNRATHCTNRA
ncbi:protein TRACHEARY ELEMENT DIFFERENTIATION-RELATED 7A-like [Mercurialis annua]|uniref:protein TRACHEARY ELEMENT DIFFERENTIATION-RELATED 7A-like n=1 Tax=Mercurialis annua TaxID=3986 RepID=UPI002160D7C2|nr:protein TRACHEARY ELEMENT DIFFERENTIATION-RELATED 7A-like [Mercurialis annua]